MQYNIVWVSFNNYVDKKRARGSVHTCIGHVTKGRYYIKYPQLSTRGGGGQNWVKFGPHSCWMTPCVLCFPGPKPTPRPLLHPEPRATTWGLCWLVGLGLHSLQGQHRSRDHIPLTAFSHFYNHSRNQSHSWIISHWLQIECFIQFP